MNHYTDRSPYKGAGECSQLISAIRYLVKHKVSFSRLFKITGRYLLAEDFSMEPYLQRRNVFRRDSTVLDREYYFTCFFKLDISSLKQFYGALLEIMRSYNSRDFKRFGGWADIEVMLPIALGKNFEEIAYLGVIQKVAVKKTINTI